ncbi:MAG: PQQ-binding-like beta-propeller repeat protein [Deltaproteobacteria bacterium]|nr:PQQ-binding-like beta-propeller repeat protein [Deltaproteobacteria bacterium]
MIKKIVCIMIMLAISFSAMAKKKEKDFYFSNKKFKPQNISLLKKAWSRGLKAGSPGKRYYPETSNPVEENGIIYVGTHANLFYALNSSTGKNLWVYKNDEPISSTAALSSDRVVFTDLGGWVISLDKATGLLNWKQDLNYEMLGRPLVVNNRVYLLHGEREVIALSADDGHIVWNSTLPAYVQQMTMRGHSSMIPDQNSLYVGLANGRLCRLSLNDGSIVWEKNLAIPLRVFKDIDSPVVMDGDSLYVGGYFGAVYRVNKQTGAVIWSSEVATGTSPLVLDNVVVVSDTNGAVHGLDKSDGQQIWFNELEGGVLSAPVLFDAKVFVTTFEKNAYLLDTENGYQIQKINLGGGSLNTPRVAGESVYLLTNDARLVALRKK